MMNFVQPPILRGTEAAQMAQIRSYLYQLSRDLNHTLSNLSAENFSTGSAAQSVLSGGMSKEQKKTLQEGLGNLKSLIIKTADAVTKTVETLSAELHSDYVAESEFGTYTENIDTILNATAAGLDLALNYYADLSDLLHGVSEDFDSYKTDVQGYIRQGIIAEEDGKPTIGIAIGRDILTTGEKETVDGKEYEVIDKKSDMAIWTTERLSFYVNGLEVAYFANNALNVDTVIVNTKLVIGEAKWQIDHSRGFALQWIGG